MPNKNPNKAIYGRFFLANASKVEITPEYIIPMPQFLIDFARISTEAVIEGKGDFARLWNISEWEAFHFVGFEDVLRRLKI
jgi:DNA-binding transcriptional regulator/RsmH inhibitor MraZ